MPLTMEESFGSYQKLVREYQFLSNLESLDISQENSLADILDLAIHDPVLDRLIQNFELEALSPEDRHAIFDQQAKMREYIGINCQLFSTCAYS